MPNIKLSYLYRDSGNYKNFGEIVFDNPSNIPLEIVVDLLMQKLIDGQWFYAKDYCLPDLHFDKWNEDLDHGFHEFESLEYTHDPPNASISLDGLITLIRKTNWIY